MGFPSKLNPPEARPRRFEGPRRRSEPELLTEDEQMDLGVTCRRLQYHVALLQRTERGWPVEENHFGTSPPTPKKEAQVVVFLWATQQMGAGWSIFGGFLE